MDEWATLAAIVVSALAAGLGFASWRPPGRRIAEARWADVVRAYRELPSADDPAIPDNRPRPRD